MALFQSGTASGFEAAASEPPPPEVNDEEQEGLEQEARSAGGEGPLEKQEGLALAACACVLLAAFTNCRCGVLFDLSLSRSATQRLDTATR